MTEDEAESVMRRARSLAFFEDTPEPEGLLSDLVDDQAYQVASRIDSSLERQSVLRLRLVGSRVDSGIYDPQIEERLAGPLGKELAAAGDSRLEQARLGLFAISPGSVVLHYKPLVPILADDGQQTGLEVTPADAAVRRVLRLHSLFENQADPGEIARLAIDNEPLLRSARNVVEALNDFDLDMSATWWSPSGEMVRSTLTGIGRAHALEIFAQTEKPLIEVVWGLVSALDVDGEVTLRRPGSKVKVQVGPELVRDFVLGELVQLRVTSRASVDQVGLQRGRIIHDFVERLRPDPMIDWGI